MALGQRKQREKEQFRGLVIQAAYGLIKQAGLEGLTLRKLASALEYSTSKLYHEFGSKQDIIVLLAEDICQRQNGVLEQLETGGDPEEHLLKCTHEAMLFYTNEPWSAGILAAVRFGAQGTELPPAFKTAAERSRRDVAALNLAALATSAALDEGLNVMRALMLGALSLLRPDSEESEKNLVVKIVDDGVKFIISGWKLLSLNKIKNSK